MKSISCLLSIPKACCTCIGRVKGGIYALVLLLVAGCATVSQQRVTKEDDLSPIQLGANRETVERLLGKPVAERTLGGQTVTTYTYNREHLQQSLDGGGLTAEIVFLPWQPIIWVVVAESVEKQKERLEITYGSDGRISKLDQSLVRARERFLDAACGDANAKYLEGYRYENGLGVSTDYVLAYFWYQLATASGRPEALLRRNAVVTKLTGEQLRKAEQMFGSWTSPDCTNWQGGQR